MLPIVQWVENGVAPAQITATDTIGNTKATRPVYPYPLVPKYKGGGVPTTDASSFEPALSPAAGQYTKWIGNYLFDQPVRTPG